MEYRSGSVLFGVENISEVTYNIMGLPVQKTIQGITEGIV